MIDKDVFWQEFTEYLSTVLSDAAYSQWVSQVYPSRISQDRITLVVPNNAFKTYWERHLTGYIMQFSEDNYGKVYEPTFAIVPLHAQRREPIETKQPKVDVKLDDGEEEFSWSNNSQLNPRYTFDTFVIGEGNKLAASAAIAATENPGKTYNPFLIYGGVGLGKTHLMQAIGNALKEEAEQNNITDYKIKYATTEVFVNDYVESVRTNTMDDFRRAYRDVDVLLIDDIQFLADKEKTQDEFFHTFNILYEQGKQIVLTSDRLPNEIDDLEERLKSRFHWGLIADISPPDLELRIAILHEKANEKNYDISSETINYIANHIDTNVRELEGALTRVYAHAAIYAIEDITPSVASEALANIIGPEEKKPLNVQEIIKEVSRYYGISVEDIKGKKRVKNIVLPRQIAMYLTRELTELSFPKIGEAFGGKNHTTAMHAHTKIKEDIKKDADLKRDIETLTKRLGK